MTEDKNLPTLTSDEIDQKIVFDRLIKKLKSAPIEKLIAIEVLIDDSTKIKSVIKVKKHISGHKNRTQ